MYRRTGFGAWNVTTSDRLNGLRGRARGLGRRGRLFDKVALRNGHVPMKGSVVMGSVE